MNITHYVAVIDCTYSAKNKLQKEALKYFESIDRKMIEKTDLDNFRRSIQSSIQKINNDNQRCKPMKIYFDSGYTGNSKHDSIIRDAIIVSMTLRACTAAHISALEYKSLSNN